MLSIFAEEGFLRSTTGSEFSALKIQNGIHAIGNAAF